MRKKAQIYPFIIFTLLVILVSGLKQVWAEPLLQPGQPVNTPLPEETPVSIITTVVPEPTKELNPEYLILEDGWQNPLNLSKSGATSQSQFVFDSSGNRHVLWLDELEGFGYTVENGGQWSKPTAGEYPFFTRRLFPDIQSTDPTPLFVPHLAADGDGQIFAFWINEEANLYYSSVPANNFADYGSWTPRTLFAGQVLTMATATGDDGSLHLIYIRTEDTEANPSGIYHQKLNPNGAWGNATLLYASRYLRSVPASEANIQILAAQPEALFVTWDDSLRQQVFFAASDDNGSSWQPAQEVDRRGRDDARDAAGPAQITAGAYDGQLHLTWLAGHEQDLNCSQYTATSSDGGSNWTNAEVLGVLPVCFIKSQFLVADEKLFLLGTMEQPGEQRDSIISTSYLLVWDGTRWSEPQIQNPLTSFTNPGTNQEVRLFCHEGHGQGNEISVLGCDSADGSDIWIVGRETGEVDAWFPAPPIWQGPIEISAVGAEAKEAKLVASGDGSIHSLWTTLDGPSIFYAGFNGENWGIQQEVIVTSGNNISSFDLAAANDKLYIVWKDTDLGLFLSEAATTSPYQWTNPIQLAQEFNLAASPSIVADRGGNIFIAFSVELNEERGVYFLHSADAGATWGEPVQVFDGTSSSWDMVDKPILTRTDNGHMHLLWRRRSLPPDSVPLGLAYSRSEDLGRTWSDAQLIVEAESYWYELVGAGEQIVHRFWNQEGSGRDGVWHSFSVDGGINWNPPEQADQFSGRAGLAAAVDQVHRPNLLAIENGRLENLVWQDSEWTESDGLDTDFGDNGNLAAQFDARGRLIVSYVNPASNVEDPQSRLYGMWRTVEMPSDLPTPPPPNTPTAPAPTAAPTSTPEPTPTVFFSTEQEQNGFGNIEGLSGLPVSLDIILAFIPVLLIVGIGLIIGVRILRKR